MGSSISPEDLVSKPIQQHEKQVGFLGLTGYCGCWVQTPFGFEGFLDFLGRREFEVTDFSGDDGTFMSRLQFGDQFGLEFASFLRVQVTNFLRDIDKRGDGFVVAFFISLCGYATSSANLDRQFFTRGITDKFT